MSWRAPATRRQFPGISLECRGGPPRPGDSFLESPWNVVEDQGPQPTGPPPLCPFSPSPKGKRTRLRPADGRTEWTHRKSSRFGCLGGLGGPRRPFQTKEGLARHLADEGANLPGPNVALRARSSLGNLKIGSPAVRRPDGVDAPEIVPFLRPADGRQNGYTGAPPEVGVWAALGSPGDPSKQRRASPLTLQTGVELPGPKVALQLDLCWGKAQNRVSGRSTAGRRAHTGSRPVLGVWAAWGAPGDPSKRRRATPLTLRTRVRTSGPQCCLASWNLGEAQNRVGPGWRREHRETHGSVPRP